MKKRQKNSKTKSPQKKRDGEDKKDKISVSDWIAYILMFIILINIFSCTSGCLISSISVASRLH
jgi:hypothetical protein